MPLTKHKLVGAKTRALDAASAQVFHRVVRGNYPRYIIRLDLVNAPVSAQMPGAVPAE